MASRIDIKKISRSQSIVRFGIFNAKNQKVNPQFLSFVRDCDLQIKDANTIRPELNLKSDVLDAIEKPTAVTTVKLELKPDSPRVVMLRLIFLISQNNPELRKQLMQTLQPGAIPLAQVKLILNQINTLAGGKFDASSLKDFAADPVRLQSLLQSGNSAAITNLQNWERQDGFTNADTSTLVSQSLLNTSHRPGIDDEANPYNSDFNPNRQ